MPADSVLFFRPDRGHFLLQEAGVSVAQPMREVDLDFLIGETVREIRSEDQIHFGTEGLYVHVETETDCADRSGQQLQLTELGARSVATASAVDGVLLLVFADGATLRCGPHPEYESWHVEGGRPWTLITCRPGGELSVWDETPPVPYAELREQAPAWAQTLDEMCEVYGMPRPSGFPPPPRRSLLSRWRRS